ncbi:MAG: peptidyl-tRNA hydrolase Pth2 [Methanobrevibacter sp.]|jgi:PTH2 family peptidyl-tRNA hydrolase|nr:peptidyl-tRNA hydrolase Pth2 [Candidatus Methanovirga meridionalis]
MKQIIIVRRDLKMSKGKTAAQSCHACLGSYKKADKEKIQKWETNGQAKIVLRVDNLEELLEVQKSAILNNLPNCLVIDQGRTELPPSTITCLGIGPDEDLLIDKITKDLKLLN